jgi:hypothetical protein
MKRFLVLALLAAGLGGAGCDGSGDGADGSGASGGAGASGGSGGGMSTTSGTTTAPSCDGLINSPNECGLCVEGQCCVPLQACLQDDTCSACLRAGSEDPSCDANDLIAAINACAAELCPGLCTTGTDPVCDPPAVAPSMGACVEIDGAGIKCNPITNDGCDTAAGEACDGTETMGFSCFPDGNTQAVCEPCGDADGYCQPGATCLGACAKFCCDDADCGSGTCKKGGFGDPDVGYCAVAM